MTSALYYILIVAAHWLFATTYWVASHEMPKLLYGYPELEYNHKVFNAVNVVMWFFILTIPILTNYYLYGLVTNSDLLYVP